MGKKARVPLFLCLIDLQKAYGSLDRTFVGQVVAHFGVPQQIIEMVLHGIYSKRLEVAKGLRQGVMFLPQLFSVLVAAKLLVAPEIYSEDVLILTDLVHPK